MWTVQLADQAQCVQEVLRQIAGALRKSSSVSVSQRTPINLCVTAASSLQGSSKVKLFLSLQGCRFA